MQLSIVFALAGLAAAAPTAEITPGDKHNVTMIDAERVHQNILEQLDPNHVIPSEDLFRYLQDNREANYTIYLNDTRKLVDLSSVEYKAGESNSTLDTREPGPWSCATHREHWAEQVQSWWTEWNRASSCLWNGYSSQPATQNINWQHTKSIQTNTGLDFKIIKDVLSIAAGFSVTDTWSHGGALTCSIPGNSVGQIWVQNKVVWGWMWERTCQTCTNQARTCWATAKGGALAPLNSDRGGEGVQYGCSTGWDKVQC